MCDYIGTYQLGPNDTPENGIYTGDARELAKEIPDESIDLIFTDPVYQNIEDYRWLAETAARVLRQRGSCVAFVAHHHQLSCGTIMLSWLNECPILEHRILGPRGRLFPWSLICNMLPALWLSKGLPDSNWMALQIDSFITSERGHAWGKNADIVKYRIEHMSQSGRIVLDPFCGGGTTAAVCKMLGRHYLAFEINPTTADLARERVRNTQPPLFVPQEEQVALL